MKIAFFPKLAADGIRKNRRIYFPYILMGSLMVMMYYILSFLTENSALKQMRGGSVLSSILPLGGGVIAFFSVLFLFYTNSFLIRQRNREFGLYNILGMGKRGIGRIIFWESVFVGLLAILSGLVSGIILAKIAELGFVNLLHLDVSYKLSVGITSLRRTALLYSGIYILLLISSVIRVRCKKPVDLLKSNREGEKPPKGNWLFAFAGLLCLGIAYYLAVSIKEPLSALTVFFVAVLLVIAATYLLFISGSVVYCRLLQKNKGYYYRPNHFVSVASMTYRMKRNGAGLASICILLTMVLVMISSTASLYFGMENSIRNRYPNGVNITASFNAPEGLADENIEMLRSCVETESGERKAAYDFRTGEIAGLFTDKGINVDVNSLTEFNLTTYDNVGYLMVISLEDYNRMAFTDETLKDGECMLYGTRMEYTSDTFILADGRPYKVKKNLDSFFSVGSIFESLSIPTLYLVVDDFEAFVEPVASLTGSDGRPMMQFEWQYGFDTDTAKEETRVTEAIQEAFGNLQLEEKHHVISYSVASREAHRASYFEMNGGLFFLGIMLSIVFLMAAVLIIYYKQISEGYEDQLQFEIMQKVGMTKREIRKSVNSQILTVFFSPFLFAGIHLAFAFPLLWKMLLMFGLSNRRLIIIVTVISYISFSLIYAVVYKITSNSYYTIVSGKSPR